MRISDWSSDVCSSDLSRAGAGRSSFAATQATRKTGDGDGGGSMTDGGAASRSAMTVQRPHFCNWRCHSFGGPWRSATWLRALGSATCREREWQYVLIVVGDVTLQQKTTIENTR